jgi:hypothetical protein
MRMPNWPLRQLLRKLLIVQNEGIRQVKRTIDHFNLDVILAVGYRVRSQRGYPIQAVGDS